MTVAIILLAILTFTALSSFGGINARADDSAIDVSTKDDTSFYMIIHTDGMKMYPVINSALDFASGAFSVPRNDITFTFNFTDVKYNDMSFLVTSVKNVGTCYKGSIYNYHFIFSDNPDTTKDDEVKGNVRVNIRESFYNYFKLKESDLSNFTVTWYRVAGSYQMKDENGNKNFSPKVELKTEPKKPGTDDPNSPNFEPGDNGALGSSGAAQNVYWFINFIRNWFNRTFDTGISYNTFSIWFYVVCGVLIALVLVFLFYKIFK